MLVCYRVISPSENCTLESLDIQPFMLRDLIYRVRPAPLQAALLQVAGMRRRRTVISDGARFHVDPSSNLGRSLASGCYEPQMVAVLRTYLTEGSTFVDLGANEGFFTVLAAGLVGPHGSVVAVEPQSRLQPVIQHNLAINRRYNTRIIRCALAGRSGPVHLFIAPSLNTGASSLFRPTAYTIRRERVDAWTLEDFLNLAGLGRVNLMKVDIEGAEYEVLMNAGDVLKRGGLRNIVLEIHNSLLDRRQLRGFDLHKFLLQCGYTLNNSLGPWVYEFHNSGVSADSLEPV